MKFLYKKYQAKRKEIISVEIKSSTKVKFLTAHDFKLYQRGKTHRYYGGTYDPGEVKFVLPYDSVWHAVVEQGTYRAPVNIGASCTLLAPDRDTLSSIAMDAPDSVRHAIENNVEAISDSVSELSDDLNEVANEVLGNEEGFADAE